MAPAVISIHMEEPGDLVARARDCGIRWMQQVMDLDQAKQALERDVDAGFRGGGVRGHVEAVGGFLRRQQPGGSESGLTAVACWTRTDMLVRYIRARASERAADKARRLNLGAI